MGFNSSDILNGIRHLLKNLATKILMRDCPSTEPNADFDFVAFIQELSCVLQTGIEICFTNSWAQADFLDGDSLLFLPSIALFLLNFP